MELSELIAFIIKNEVENHEESFRFREPIVGFASADDPLYDGLSEKIGNVQLHPKEILPGAKTVVVYFIPFSLTIIKEIQGKRNIVTEWSKNYTITNLLLTKISRVLKRQLQAKGVHVATESPTDDFNPIELTTQWSHKASAVISGVGTFGLNHLVITKSGTAGRLNSIIIDAEIPPTSRPDDSYCLYYKTGRCKVCVEKCPSGALQTEHFDRFRCNAYLDGKNIHDLQQGCGMCSAGPCAAKGFF